MNLHRLLRQDNEWISGRGALSDVVLSTRVRLARNRGDLPFPMKASDEQKREVLEDFRGLALHIPDLDPHLFLVVDEMDAIDREFMFERHLVSRDLIQPGSGKAALVTLNERVSIMINEEDHFRLQVLLPGFELKSAWQHMNRLDEGVGHRMRYAFSPRLGFLTACPTNVGTGLRASVMLHLPALVLAKQISQVLQATLKLGLTFRGLYGEGSDVIGHIFQVSNQITLGFQEEDIVDNLEKVISQIIDHERNARKYLLKNELGKIEDMVWRAFGLLSFGRNFESKEALELLSMLRMGVNLGLIDAVPLSAVNELLVLIQPAHLQLLAGGPLAEKSRDEFRAQVIRERLAKPAAGSAPEAKS